MTTTSARPGWPIATGLILLSAVPVAAGAARLSQLAAGAPVTPANERFFAIPVPVVLHIIGATGYCILGAFQFVPGFRRRRPGWHRAAGRLLVPCGLIAAWSGLWMTVFYPKPPGDGAVVTGERLVFGSLMIASIVLGFAAVRRRDITQHRAWMIRGYAIGQGAGTQVLTHLPWTVFIGTPGESVRSVLMGAGWVINLAVAEWIIRRSSTRPIRTSSALVMETS